MPVDVMPFTSGKLKNNSYIVTDRDTFCVVIDPGEHLDPIIEQIQDQKVDYILLTHCHFDHISGLNDLRKYTDAPVVAHRSEAEWLLDPKLNGSSLMGTQVVCDHPDILLNGDEWITCSSTTIKVIHTPGHSPGSTCFLINDRDLFTGDTLLAGTVGPTNIPFGDRDLQIQSIKDKLFSLADDMVVYPGHGRKTMLEYEKKHNVLPNIKVKYHF